MAKRVSGWNLFMSEQMKKYKEEVKSSTDRLKRVAADWKVLPQVEKDVWIAQAKALHPVPVLEEMAPKKVGHISGYNIFMREQTKVLKGDVKDGRERLRLIGANWKKLSKVEQGVWNEQAKAL